MFAFLRALRFYFLLMWMNIRNQFLTLASPIQPPPDSDSHSSPTHKCDHVFVTLIRATDVACNLRRIPAGFHVIVEVDGRIIQTSNKSVSTEKDAVEWDEEVLLPSNQSSSVLFSIYASFELGPRLGNGELLGQFKITVGELSHNRNKQLQFIDFTAQEDDILPSCLSLSIITERRICDTDESCPELDLPESSEMNALEQLTDEGHHALMRYRRRQDQIDLDTAIQTFERVQEICSIDHPNRSAVLFNLANARFIDCQVNNRYFNLDVPIGLYRDALRLRSKNHPDHCTTALELGLALLVRFQRRGFKLDEKESRDLLAGVVQVSGAASYAYRAGLFGLQMAKDSVSVEAGDAGSPPREQADHVIQKGRDLLRNWSYSHPHRPKLLIGLGVLLSDRFERSGVLADIHDGISMFEDATDLTPHRHPDMLSLLSNHGTALRRRFDHFGDLADINRSVSMLEEAVCLMSDGHPDKLVLLKNLGNSLRTRFERLGDLADLNRSISLFEEAVRLTPDNHPNKPVSLDDLGTALCRRFNRLGDLTDLNRSISITEEAVFLTPEGHPDKPGLLNNLGKSLSHRFERLGDLADLNRSISTTEEAVCLSPDGHPRKPALFDGLGSSLCRRFERLGDLADLSRSISMSEEAIYLSPVGHSDKPGLLAHLGNSLFSRFKRLGDLADLNRSILITEEAVCLTPDSRADKPGQLNNLGHLLLRRFERLGDLADINRSISTAEEAVCLTPDDHPDKPGWLNNLGNSLYCRFERLGDLADLNTSILMKEKAVSLTPDGHPNKPTVSNDLGSSLCCRFNRLGDLADLNRSMLMFEKAVCMTPDGHSDKPRLLNNLGTSLHRRFQRLGDLADIVKSISLQEKAISCTPDGHPNKPTLLIGLGDAFIIRFKHSHDSSDLSAAALNFSIASHASIGPAPTGLRAAHSWMFCAQLQGNTAALLDACASALDLLPQLAWLGLQVTERHRLLVEAAQITRHSVTAALEAGHPELAVEWREQGRSIVWTQFMQLRTPLDDLAHEHPALACQFRQISQELEHASTRDNPTFCQPANISVADTRLLEKDIQRHHDLALRRENLLLQIRSLPGFDRFLLPKTIKQLTALACQISGPVVYLTTSTERCDALIVMAELESVIHVPLPEICFRDMDVLRRMLRGMLGDRLVFSRDALYELIPSEDKDLSKKFLDLLLNGDFTNGNDQAAKMKPQRIGGHSKPNPQQSEEYTPNELHQMILKHLWNHAVNPVLQALSLSNPPSDNLKMTRIFWCPTGPFSFLPIHAAGLYDTTEAGTKLSDFVISSYLPTLSSLALSPQNSLDHSSSKLRLLAVPQPPTDGHRKLFSVEEEINSIRELSDRSPFVTFQNSDGAVEDVMEKLKNNDWVHFACHGIQDPEKPLDSGLCLANKHRLKLSDIMQLSRPKGGLAFLSACQTAQGDKALAEESVHLAAGMLLAGYGSVIGTMWSMMDNDGPKVARDVYEHLFRLGDVGQAPDSTESAAALHRAVQHLRDSGAQFKSWVPFVHFGR